MATQGKYPVSERWVSTFTGEKIEAHLVDRVQWFTDFDDNKTYAEPGEYLITYPYMDKIDSETFEKEYERYE